jgi:hypothetical protein
LAGVTGRFGNSVYPAISRNDNHSRQSDLAPERYNGNRARPLTTGVALEPRGTAAVDGESLLLEIFEI